MKNLFFDGFWAQYLPQRALLRIFWVFVAFHTWWPKVSSPVLTVKFQILRGMISFLPICSWSFSCVVRDGSEGVCRWRSQRSIGKSVAEFYPGAFLDLRIRVRRMSLSQTPVSQIVPDQFKVRKVDSSDPSFVSSRRSARDCWDALRSRKETAMLISCSLCKVREYQPISVRRQLAVSIPSESVRWPTAEASR